MRSVEELRENLSKAILHVRSGHATSRRALAELLRLSPSTTGYYVDQLIASGHLIESGLEQGRMGRPKRVLRTVPSAGWFAGVEFHAERIQAVRVDFSGVQSLTLSQVLPEGADTASVLRDIARLIQELQPGAVGPLLGIGIGAPGLIDPAAGVGLFYSFLPDWRNVPVRDELVKKNVTAPIILENNLRVIALAERWFGGGRELEDYVILGPRSGFGIAVMKHGRLLDGQHHATGEIGRWVWPLDGAGGGDASCAQRTSGLAQAGRRRQRRTSAGGSARGLAQPRAGRGRGLAKRGQRLRACDGPAASAARFPALFPPRAAHRPGGALLLRHRPSSRHTHARPQGHAAKHRGLCSR